MDRDTLVCVPDFDDDLRTEVDPRRAWLLGAPPMAARRLPPPPPPGSGALPERLPPPPCPRTPTYVPHEHAAAIPVAGWPPPEACGTPAPARLSDASLAVHRGQITVVLGCRGGAGATTVAVNTAAALAGAGRAVCVLDLDLELGDVLVALDVAGPASLARVADEVGELDAAALARRLARHRTGLYALSQVGHVDGLDGQLVDRLPGLLRTLSVHFDHLVVDGIRDFGPVARTALDVADRVVLVVTQDVPSVRRAARAVTRLRRLGYADQRIRVVVNRTRRGALIDARTIERALGLRVDARVREDRRASAALDEGVLLGERRGGRRIAGDLAAVAALFGDERTAPCPRRGIGWSAFLRRLVAGGERRGAAVTGEILA